MTVRSRALPPVLGRLLSGTFWLALRTPLQAVIVFWSMPLILEAIGVQNNDAFLFAWGLGFLQFVLEFGMSSALQRLVSERWTRGDREGVDRAIACGMIFYAAVSLIQALALLGIAYLAMPDRFWGAPYQLAFNLLWLQALTAPCYGLSMVTSSVLQAARRYDFLPRLELIIVVFRFLILVAGLRARIDFFLIVLAQSIFQIGLGLGPALWVMLRELGCVPHFRGARFTDLQGLLHVSFYVFLIQLSVVLADKVDTTILAYALPTNSDAGITTYAAVSKPFFQIRQTGWMLAYLVMPAVASLAAAHDEKGLERIKYDGSRLLVGLLLPVALLAAIYAHPFLVLWMNNIIIAQNAHLMRLFLVATLPLIISVLVQMAIGINKFKLIAVAALIGSLINLPLSFILTMRLGVAGVIWGTVLTTLFSNLLVPGWYVFRVLEVRPSEFLRRTLGAPVCGALVMLVTVWLAHRVCSPEPEGVTKSLIRTVPLLIHLTLGSLAYLAGYIVHPTGREDIKTLMRRLLRQNLKTA